MQIPLGKATPYLERYDPSVLFPIARLAARNSLGIAEHLPFEGVDLWNAYEVSWLDTFGLPQVAVARIRYSADSEQLIESKSLKLFLGSLYNEQYSTAAEVVSAISLPLREHLGTSLGVELIALDDPRLQCANGGFGKCLDSYHSEPSARNFEGAMTTSGDESAEETIHSNLLRSLCPVTNQPDWGTVIVSYRGRKLHHGSFIDYLIRHRNFQGFHEECCERIFCELNEVLRPDDLTVACFYTRRGGIDINPIRWSRGKAPRVEYVRLIRQ